MARARRPSKTSLAIIERSYRGSLEEQYGHIVWLSRIMKGMNAPTSLMLKGDTVLFARLGQPQVRLTIGDLELDVLSHYESGIQDLLAMQVPVYVWVNDVARLQLEESDMVEGVQFVRASDMPTLINRYNCIWYW